MTALLAGPLITHDWASMWPSPPGGAACPYVAIRPALTNMKVSMPIAPRMSVGRRPQRSTQRRAGTVMQTLMTYWILDETSRLSPSRPAMAKMYKM